MHDLQQLLAERPDLYEQVAALARDIASTSRGREIDAAEMQDVRPDAWQSDEDVPGMLTTEQAQRAMHAITYRRATAIEEANKEVEQLEERCVEEVRPLADKQVAANRDVAEAKEAVREAEKVVAEAKRKLAEARGALASIDGQVQQLRSSWNVRRIRAQGECRAAKSRAEIAFARMQQAITNARRRYEEELGVVQSVAKEESSRMNRDRKAVEEALRRRKARKIAAAAAEDMEDLEDMKTDDSQSGVSIPAGVSFEQPHPLLDEVGEQASEEKETPASPSRVPWEDLAAECQVSPENYEDWLSNYQSGWGNGPRIILARRRILARRVGAEIPEWPEEIKPGKYLGRAKLLPQQAKFYTDVPEGMLVEQPAGVIH